MSVESVVTAIGLLLVIEGLMPFLAPARWRDLFVQVARLKDGQIRFMGFGLLLCGLALLILL